MICKLHRSGASFRGAVPGGVDRDGESGHRRRSRGGAADGGDGELQHQGLQPGAGADRALASIASGGLAHMGITPERTPGRVRPRRRAEPIAAVDGLHNEG